MGVCFGLAILFVVVGAVSYIIYLKVKKPEKFNDLVSKFKNRNATAAPGEAPSGTDMP
jgi:hypothetical protein